MCLLTSLFPNVSLLPPVKQEQTPSSPSHAGLKVSLPATPKSSNGDKGEDSADHHTAVPEGSQEESSKGQDERMETDSRVGQEMEVDAKTEETHFVLAPTPAQLGKAPLQRRLASSCSQDSTKDLSPTEVSACSSFSGMFSTATVATVATPTAMEEPPPSANLKKKQFFKKAKNDDMDT